MEKPLLGKTALVTGSSRKLGKYLALHLANQGANIAIHYHSGKDRALNVVEQIKKKNVKSAAFKADLRDPKQAKNLIENVVKKFKRIDILINNVGNFLHKPISKVKESEWQFIFDTNLNSTFYCTQAALPFMRKKKFGRIINIGYSPIGKIMAMPLVTPYFIAKTGVLLYSKAVAVEEAKNGITVNVLSPGTTFDSVMKPKKASDTIPAGRFAKPDDFNVVIDMLVKEEANYITGNHIKVSGGYNI